MEVNSSKLKLSAPGWESILDKVLESDRESRSIVSVIFFNDGLVWIYSLKGWDRSFSTSTDFWGEDLSAKELAGVYSSWMVNGWLPILVSIWALGSTGFPSIEVIGWPAILLAALLLASALRLLIANLFTPILSAKFKVSLSEIWFGCLSEVFKPIIPKVKLRFNINLSSFTITAILSPKLIQ